MNRAFGVEVAELERVGRKYMSLPGEQQKIILKAPLLGRFSQKARDVYVYMTTMCIEKKGELVIPAMLIPAMVGNEYAGRRAQTNFKDRYLDANGQRGVDWDFVAKATLFSMTSVDEDIEFSVPGSPGKSVVFSRSDGNRSKYPFVTPEFARHLVSSTGQDISRELRNIHFAIHDETVKYLMGLPSQLDGLLQARKKRRVEACDTVKTLAQTILEVHPDTGPREFAAVNGMTNRAVTGKTKSEWAREWDKTPRSVNLRDHMTTEALAATTALQAASSASIEFSPDQDPVSVHKRKCELMQELFGDYHAKAVVPDRLTLGNARSNTAPRWARQNIQDASRVQIESVPVAEVVAEVVEEPPLSPP